MRAGGKTCRLVVLQNCRSHHSFPRIQIFDMHKRLIGETSGCVCMDGGKALRVRFLEFDPTKNKKIK